MTDRTIDLVEVTPGLLVWDYDLRPRRVGEPAYVSHKVTWYQMFDPVTGTRGSDMDAKRMWHRHPTTGQPPAPPASRLVPLDSSDPKWEDLSTHKVLTCVNHPTVRYSTKNPWIRSIHLLRSDPDVVLAKRPDLAAKEMDRVVLEQIPTECDCPFEDLREVTG